jgi:DNA-binding GntR family transcriptional regulator
MSSITRPRRSATPRTDYTVSQLRKQILDGVVEPGDLLAELAVGKRLGVSRVPVREALITLEREGLVEFSATGRAYVKDLSVSDFEELYVLRLALEPVAAKLAAPALRRNAAFLEKNIEATRQATDLLEVTHLDLDFHELILEASGNARLVKLWRSLRSELELWLSRLHRVKQVRTHGTREETAAAHEALLHHFRTKTPAECERANRHHITSWREWLPLPEPNFPERD